MITSLLIKTKIDFGYDKFPLQLINVLFYIWLDQQKDHGCCPLIEYQHAMRAGLSPAGSFA